MNDLYHHGIKGQHWGVRRYQNQDGTLTAAGKKHYKSIQKEYGDDYKRAHNDIYGKGNKTFNEEGMAKSKRAVKAETKYTSSIRNLDNDPKYMTNRFKKKQDEVKEAYGKLQEANSWKGFKGLKRGKYAKDYQQKNHELVQMIFSGENKKFDAARDKAAEKIKSKYFDETASAILRDNGYEDNKKARTWLKDHILTDKYVSWDD